MDSYSVRDTVEVTARCAWTGDVGEVVAILGPNIYVRLPLSGPQGICFVAEDLKHSQLKLEGLDGT